MAITFKKMLGKQEFLYYNGCQNKTSSPTILKVYMEVYTKLNSRKKVHNIHKMAKRSPAMWKKIFTG